MNTTIDYITVATLACGATANLYGHDVAVGETIYCTDCADVATHDQVTVCRIVAADYV